MKHDPTTEVQSLSTRWRQRVSGRRAAVAMAGLLVSGFIAAASTGAGAATSGSQVNTSTTSSTGSAGTSASTPAITPAVSGVTHFVWTATAKNTIGDQTTINNSATNAGHANALLFVTPNFDPGGTCPCNFDGPPVGVYRDGSKWAIFNEDESAMAVGESFNVLVEPRPSADVFIQTATESNVSGDTTFIDSAVTNGKPDLQIQATQNWSPEGVYNDIPVGVWYDDTDGEWGVFNENGSGMSVGASFNIMVGVKQSGGGTGLVQKASKANELSQGATYINSAVTNNDNNAFALETPSWDPGGKGGVLDDANTGVAQNDGGEPLLAIFNEDSSAVPLKAAFNVILFSS
jgi:hypothetical protein